MITSLTQLSPATRAAAESWLADAPKAVAPDLREDIRHELLDALHHGLDEHSSPEDLERLIAEIGPVDSDNDHDGTGDRRTGAWHGIPYDLRPPTGERIKARWWNPSDPRLLSPKIFGAGWEINFGAIAVRLGLIEPDAEDDPFASTPDRAYTVGAALPVALAGAVVAHYAVRGRSLPDRLPSHWSITGVPDRTAPKRRAAAIDLAVSLGAAGVAAAFARAGRNRPTRAGLQAAAAFTATGAAATTVLRTGGDRRRPWAGPAMALGMLGAAGATLLGLALAGRNAERHRDLTSHQG